MVEKEHLQELIQNRYMVRGAVGDGKTYSLVNFAERYAHNGKRVLYIDIKERGAVRELIKLDEEALHNITYIQADSYNDICDSLENVIVGDIDLIILDPIHHLQYLSRKAVREIYLRDGEFESGDTSRSIRNPEIFDIGLLPYGGGFSIAYMKENKIIDLLLSSGADIAVSSSPTEKQSDHVGYFDTIIDLQHYSDAIKGRIWEYAIFRYRGADRNDYEWQPMVSGVDPFVLCDAMQMQPDEHS